MHAAAVDTENGLGHEGGIDAVHHGDGLHRGPQGHGFIGHFHALVITHVDLMLGRGHLMVAILNADPEFFQGKDGLAAVIVGHVQGRSVKIATLIQNLGALIAFKVKVFQLRAYVIGVALFCGLGQQAFHDVAGVAGKRRAIRLEDVAEHAGHGLLFRAPGEKLEGGGVGLGDHVALLDAGEALNGGAVKAHALIHGFFQLRGADGEAFQDPENVGEPDLDEADVVILDCFVNIFYGLTVHGGLLTRK